MMWIYGYLLIGSVTGAIYGVKNLLERPSFEVREVFRVMDSSLTLKQRIWSGVVEPLVMVVGAVLIWPLLWWMQIEDWREKSHRVPYKFDEPFKLKASDLIAQTNIEVVEQGAFVKDPLGAVPPLPFGHLNAAWKKFLQARPEGAELWTFESEELVYGDTHLQLQAGYVWVDGQVLEPLFLTQESLTLVEEENK